jgi:sugar phosphate isomerase/epimerase
VIGRREKEPEMRIACTTLACPSWSLGTILERFKQYGYDGVDFRGLAEEMEIYRLPAFSTGAAETAREIARSGLEVSAFSSGARMFSADPPEREKHMAEVIEYARLCRVFGAPLIRVFGGPLGGTGLEEAVEVAVETLGQMAEAVGEGVALAVETHDDWTRSATLAQVLERVDAPNVGALWDLHHPYRMAGESPQETYRNIGRHTIATHLKDSRPTADGKHAYCLGGEGDVPLAEMVALLKQGGYDGYLTLEWEKKWHPEIAGPEVALPAYAEFMRRLIA